MNRKEILELIELIKAAGSSIPTTPAQDKAAGEMFKKLRTLGHVLCSGNDVNPQIKSMISVAKRGEFCNSVLVLTRLNTFSIDKANLFKSHISILLNLLSPLVEEITPKKLTVFYSWQSDLPNKTNRGFIKNILEKLSKDPSFTESPRIDSDTSGVPGSPDIVNEILKKIDKCDVFVGDVSIINKGAERETPNPNVLFELGYAFKAKSSTRVLMIFNEAFGEVKKLPFDLGLKRQIAYSLGINEDKSEQSKFLELVSLCSESDYVVGFRF